MTAPEPGTLEFEMWEIYWVDAIHHADKNDDPSRLIELLAQGGPPPSVLPFLTALLQYRIGRKRGRPNILPSEKLQQFWEMEAQVGRRWHGEGRSLQTGGQGVGHQAQGAHRLLRGQSLVP